MGTARFILIAEDKGSLRRALAKDLSIENEFKTTEAASLREAGELLSAQDVRFDAVILDLGLQDGDVLAWCMKLQQQRHKVPVIILIGGSNDPDITAAFDFGANDYVAKPVHPTELLARLRAQLRIFDNREDAVLKIGLWEFYPSAKLLQGHPTHRRPIRLTQKEAEILKLLYHAGAKSVSRSVLLDKVWGYSSAVATRTLEAHIYRLRRRLEVDRTECRLLLTAPNGYRLQAMCQPTVDIYG